MTELGRDSIDALGEEIEGSTEARAATKSGGATFGGKVDWLPFLAIALVIVVTDQMTKAWLTSFLAPGQSVDVLGDLVRLVHSQNNGGLFGLFRGQALVFGLVSMVVVVLIVVYHARAGGGRYLAITLGLLLGGALGNLIDRLRLEYVVDFVDVGLGSLRWYTFNVADAGISFSLLLLVAASIWPKVLGGRSASDA